MRSGSVALWLLVVGCGPSPASDARSPDAGSTDATTDSGPGSDAGSPSLPPLELDPYGGAVDLPVTSPSGFFGVAEAYGRWWLVTPDGNAFVSMGVNNVTPTGDVDQKTGVAAYAATVASLYADEAAWAAAAADRLTDWTFNTLGAWTTHESLDGRMPVTPNLDLAGADWQSGSIPDYFDPIWEAAVQMRAIERASPRIDDSYVVGYFLDNELKWGPDWRSPDDLLDVYLSLSPTAPGKAALVTFMDGHFGGDVSAFNTAFGTTLAGFPELADVTGLAGSTPEADAARGAWAGAVADRYFSVTTTATRAADPNHLVLGCRFVAWMVPPEVVDAAASYLDVVSTNFYELTDTGRGLVALLGAFVPTDGWLAELTLRTGLPVLVSEFGARAADSGLPNTFPPALLMPVRPTQQDRADVLERYGRALAEEPHLVGIHWFEWVDEPPGGRFDGENSNWGLVNVDDVPYAPVVERARVVGPLLAYWTAM